jgi:hypothetical protein
LILHDHSEAEQPSVLDMTVFVSLDLGLDLDLAIELRAERTQLILGRFEAEVAIVAGSQPTARRIPPTRSNFARKVVSSRSGCRSCAVAFSTDDLQLPTRTSACMSMSALFDGVVSAKFDGFPVSRPYAP